jgi:aryl-alcohol dehydrogenase-like predicted oxidoreductase
MVPEGMTLAQMSLRWILDFDAVTVVIAGSKSPLQVPDNASATDLPSLPQSLHNELSNFYNENISQYIRGKY